MKLSSSVNGKRYLTSCWRQSCIMFSRRTRWSQHFQRMGTRYTSRCRGANNLDHFAWPMGDSPYYKFAPTSSPSLQWTYHIKWGETSRFCLFRRKRLSFSGSLVFRHWVRELFHFFSLVFLRACTRRYMHNLGSTLKRIRSQTNCYLWTLHESTQNYITIIVVISFR